MYVDADATDNFQQAIGAIHGFDYFCTGEESLLIPVSYTHLTLPTIYSV